MKIYKNNNGLTNLYHAQGLTIPITLEQHKNCLLRGTHGISLIKLTIIANPFKGIKIAMGILILDTVVTMIKKMHQKEVAINKS